MKNYKIPFFVVSALCLLLYFNVKRLGDRLENLKLKTIQIDSSKIIAQEQRILELEEAVRLGLIEKTHLIDRIKQQTKVKTKTIIVEKKIPIRSEKIIIVDSTKMDTSNFVRVPFKVLEEDSFFFLSGHVDTSYFTLDTLSVINALSIVVGEHKGKWWQKNTPMVEVKSSNPYTQIEVENVTIKQKKKFWQSPLFGAVVGALSVLLIL